MFFVYFVGGVMVFCPFCPADKSLASLAHVNYASSGLPDYYYLQDVGRGHDEKTLTLAKILIRFIQFLIHGVSAVSTVAIIGDLVAAANQPN